MAVLICETIRCNDDGTCVRMAMREIVDWYRQNSTKENDSFPFKAVFTGEGASKSLPQAVFSFAGGKPRIQQQVLQKFKFGGSYKKYYDEDAETLESQKKYISDNDEETTPQSYPYQRVSNQPYMGTRDTVPKISPGFFTDPPSSTVPSPARVPFSAARTFGNNDAIHFHLDEQSEEQENDTLAPLGEHFCQKCNLLYWRPFGRSDATILNECPNCHFTDSIIMIPDEDVAGLVIENHMKEGSITTFPNGTEGIFLNE